MLPCLPWSPQDLLLTKLPEDFVTLSPSPPFFDCEDHQRQPSITLFMFIIITEIDIQCEES